MIRTLRTLLLAGLGTLDVTEEKLRSVFEDLVKRGEVTEKDARDLVATWTTRATERRDAFRKQVRELVREELKMGEVRREEFEALAELVSRLERRTPPPTMCRYGDDGPPSAESGRSARSGAIACSLPALRIMRSKRRSAGFKSSSFTRTSTTSCGRWTDRATASASPS